MHLGVYGRAERICFYRLLPSGSSCDLQCFEQIVDDDVTSCVVHRRLSQAINSYVGRRHRTSWVFRNVGYQKYSCSEAYTKVYRHIYIVYRTPSFHLSLSLSHTILKNTAQKINKSRHNISVVVEGGVPDCTFLGARFLCGGAYPLLAFPSPTKLRDPHHLVLTTLPFHHPNMTGPTSFEISCTNNQLM